MTAAPKSLNVSLAPELTTFIGSRVASGRYRSASEVVRAALRLLEREEAGMLAERLAKQPEPASGQTPGD